ncbi:MAG: hypothetical protein MI748_16015 [Opitutales bacterium]|nr:hypothetical protein [Opitutales bacterium]
MTQPADEQQSTKARRLRPVDGRAKAQSAVLVEGKVEAQVVTPSVHQPPAAGAGT